MCITGEHGHGQHAATMTLTEAERIKRRNELAVRHMKVASHAARIIYQRTPNDNPLVRFEDLLSVAYTALLEAAEKYDESKGSPRPFFDTICQLRCRDYLRSIDHLSRHFRHQLKQAGREAPVREPYKSSILPSSREADPWDRLQRADAVELLLRGLDDRQRKIMLMYYIDEMSQEEIGKAVGVSESRISQIRNESMKFIRENCRRCAGRREAAQVD